VRVPVPSTCPAFSFLFFWHIGIGWELAELGFVAFCGILWHFGASEHLDNIALHRKECSFLLKDAASFSFPGSWHCIVWTQIP
jgi:hypothetical protein